MAHEVVRRHRPEQLQTHPLVHGFGDRLERVLERLLVRLLHEDGHLHHVLQGSACASGVGLDVREHEVENERGVLLALAFHGPRDELAETDPFVVRHTFGGIAGPLAKGGDLGVLLDDPGTQKDDISGWADKWFQGNKPEQVEREPVR